MATRYKSLGTQLEHETAPSSGTFTPIAALTEMDGPGGDTEEIDVSAHDSPGQFRQTLPSFRDPGEIDFGGWEDPNEATHDGSTGLAAFWLDGVVRQWRVQTPTGAALALEPFASFDAFIRSLRFSTPFDGAFGFTSTLRLSGLPTFL